MTAPRASIRRRLLLSLSLVTVGVWFIVMVVAYFSTRDETNDLYDGELSQLARVLLTLYTSSAVVPGNSGEALVTSAPFEGGENYERKLLFQIWDRDGTLRVRSANAPEQPISSNDGGFSTGQVFGQGVRIYVLDRPNEPVIVMVAQRLEIRGDIAQDLIQGLLITVLIALPLLLWLMRSSVFRSFAPLVRVADEIDRRASDNLEPISQTTVPVEIQSLMNALNNLLSRIKDSLEREKRFVADAAHELRTPLAGLYTHSQVALRTTDQDERLRSLHQIQDGVNRMTRIIEQLLCLSRVDAQATPVHLETVDLAAVVDEVVETLKSLAAGKNVEVSVSTTPGAMVKGDEESVRILLRNLVDNAIRYTPAGGLVDISLECGEHGTVVRVSDTGPGIPEPNRRRVFDRFYREVGTRQPGSGLGLAIAKSISDNMQARLFVENRSDGRGLEARVIFPQPGQDGAQP